MSHKPETQDPEVIGQKIKSLLADFDAAVERKVESKLEELRGLNVTEYTRKQAKLILGTMTPIERLSLIAELGTFDAFVSTTEAQQILGITNSGSMRRLAATDKTLQAVKIGGRDWLFPREPLYSYHPRKRGHPTSRLNSD